MNDSEDDAGPTDSHDAPPSTLSDELDAMLFALRAARRDGEAVVQRHQRHLEEAKAALTASTSRRTGLVKDAAHLSDAGIAGRLDAFEIVARSF
ncbi:hypothetical protein HDU96_000105 [Phlyctochytrium bullatum]|nr:hypothetical protein HDU96_000105 [Phlyctochytrium bullatum]